MKTAAFREVADTVDAAREGGIGGAVGHIASKLPGGENIVTAAKTGNMANYVKASLAFGSNSDRAKSTLNNADNIASAEMISTPKIQNENPNSAESLYERLNNGKELL